MSVSYTPLPCTFKDPSTLSGLAPDASILVAFSGGADSTALLHLLSRYSQASGARIYAAHVNHGIRGDEADRDEQFCRELAKSLGVEIFVLRADVPKIALETRESVETAARRVRYDFFDKIMQEHGIRILATAHNANDNLETLIFNMARGTGLDGLCGIPDSRPTSFGVVIRPMLAMEKSEIIDYCRQNSLDFVTDSTNTDTDYTRNMIRAEIIPAITKINSGALRNAHRMCRTLKEDSLCLDALADEFIAQNCNGYSVSTEWIRSSPKAIVNRVLMRLYADLSGGKTLEATHVDALVQLAERAIAHSSISLPHGFEGVIEQGSLLIRISSERERVEDYKILLFDGLNTISQTKSEIFIGNSHDSKNVYKKETILYIDFATIEGELYARPRKAGDKIRSNGMSKSVKKLMCDKKIPIEWRDRLPMICDANGIVAIPFVCVRDGARTNCENCEKQLHFRFI